MKDIVEARIKDLENKIKNYDPHYNGGFEVLLGWQIRLDELQTLLKRQTNEH